MLGKITTQQENEYKKFIVKLYIIVGFAIILLFVYKILDILLILFFSFFLNILFAPFLNFFNKYKIKDSLGITLIYLIILILLFITIFSIVPIFIKQLLLLITQIEHGLIAIKNVYLSKGIEGFDIPQIFKSLLSNLDFSYVIDYIKTNISSIGSFLGNNFKNFLTNGFGIFSVITNAFVNLSLLTIFTFFIALERQNIRIFFYKILPINTSKYLLSREETIVSSLHNWFKGQLLLCISIFFLTLIGLFSLKLFGINIGSHFTLALIAGIMEFIPYIGPFLALLPVIAIALGISMKVVGVVIILYILIQQIEGNLLVPFVMGKTLSISPFVVILAMTIGGSIFGIVGILLAVPIVSVIQIFIGDYLKSRK